MHAKHRQSSLPMCLGRPLCWNGYIWPSFGSLLYLKPFRLSRQLDWTSCLSMNILMNFQSCLLWSSTLSRLPLVENNIFQHIFIASEALSLFFPSAWLCGRSGLGLAVQLADPCSFSWAQKASSLGLLAVVNIPIMNDLKTRKIEDIKILGAVLKLHIS